jgi:hypothetical protein
MRKNVDYNLVERGGQEGRALPAGDSQELSEGSMNDSAALHRVSRIVHLAMLGSIVAYGIIVLAVAGPKPVEQEASVDVVGWVARGIALLLAIAGVLLYRRTAVSDNAPVEPRRMLTRYLQVWALFETVALLGLVRAFLGGQGLLLIVASLVLIAVHPPKGESFGRSN